MPESLTYSTRVSLWSRLLRLGQLALAALVKRERTSMYKWLNARLLYMSLRHTSSRGLLTSSCNRTVLG